MSLETLKKVSKESTFFQTLDFIFFSRRRHTPNDLN